MMRNMVLLGATIGKKDNLVIGQSIMSWNKEHKGGSSLTAVDIALLELGPRVVWYLNDNKTVAFSGAWHPYVKGERKNSSGVSEDLSGSSIHAAMIYQFKVNKTFFIGASLNYHSVSIAEKTVGTTLTKVSEKYTDIYPAFDISLRFR